MVLRSMPLVVAVLLAAATAASAQLTFDHHPKKDPYRNLFGNPGRAQTNSPPVIVTGRVAQKPFAVCGTLIVPADPRVDPKIRVSPPNDRVEHKLRIVIPPICKPE